VLRTSDNRIVKRYRIFGDEAAGYAQQFLEKDLEQAKETLSRQLAGRLRRDNLFADIEKLAEPTSETLCWRKNDRLDALSRKRASQYARNKSRRQRSNSCVLRPEDKEVAKAAPSHQRKSSAPMQMPKEYIRTEEVDVGVQPLIEGTLNKCINWNNPENHYRIF